MQKVRGSEVLSRKTVIASIFMKQSAVQTGCPDFDSLPLFFFFSRVWAVFTNSIFTLKPSASMNESFVTRYPTKKMTSSFLSGAKYIV